MSDAGLVERLGAALGVWFVVFSVIFGSLRVVLEATTVPEAWDRPLVFLGILGVSAPVAALLTSPRVRTGRLVGFWLTSALGARLTDSLLGPPAGLAGHPLLVLDALLAVIAAITLSAAFWYRLLPDEPLAWARGGG